MDIGGIALAIGALLGAGGVTALVQARAVNRRTLAQAHQVDADAEVTLGGGWQTLVREVRAETAAARSETATVRAEANVLRERLARVEEREQECQSRLALLEAGQAGVSGRAIERVVQRLVTKEIDERTSGS